MSDIAHLYPPAPAAVPPDLTASSPAYRTRVIIVLLSLLAFVVVYLALTIGSAYACYALFSSLSDDPKPTYAQPSGGAYQYKNYNTSRNYSSSHNDKPVFWYIVGGVACGLIFLFMVKGLFKGSRRDTGVRVDVTERDQPELFAFIRQLCKDTHAPFPHRVFLTPDVNAAVSFQESLLNLIFPSRKNLIIGLGLVNRLNLAEFKAVLAHEFGHFSQSSMRLGSYVYTANRVIGDVVYGRDWLDDVLTGASRTDIRIAIFAWGFMGILWVMRGGLKLLFRGINFAHVSLSRQMEYNADLVAVSVTGSDALIYALARLDFASESLGQAWADLTAAADHSRFTRDLYFHQTKAAEFLKVRRSDPKLGEVEPLPEDPSATVQVFKPEDTSVPAMWATHPSNHDRETNAKHRYIRGPVDDRSAWVIFAQQPVIKEAVTREVYQSAGRITAGTAVTLEEPEAIQEFIDAEHAETTYDPKYHGLYDNRYVKPGELAELSALASLAEFENRARLEVAHAELLGADLKDRMDAHKARHDEVGKLARISGGAVELRGNDFEHRGDRYRLTDASRLLKQVEEELDGDYKWMHARDREVFRVHYAMAAQLGEADRAELEERYRFHLSAQELHAVLVAHSRHVNEILGGMVGRREVAQDQFQAAVAALRGAHETLQGHLDAAQKLRLPPLKNMVAGDPLGKFLLNAPLIANLPAGTSTINGEWVHKFMTQMGEVIDKAARILFKSLGGLLTLQRGIAERWATAWPRPTATEAEAAATEAPAEAPSPSPERSLPRDE